MSLREWQAALADVVLSPGSAANFDRFDLTDAERLWLSHLTPATGFKVTREVQRWWRQYRVEASAPLTLAALGPDYRDAVVATYLERFPNPSSFFLREALGFLDFVAGLSLEVAHLGSVVQFERAMLRLRQASMFARSRAADPPPVDACVARHPLAALVAFHASPAAVLGAVVKRESLPPVERRDPTWLLLAPGLPRLAREATTSEARLFQECDATADDTRDALATLWQAGALVAASK